MAEVQGLKEVANQALVSLIQNATDALTFLKGEVPLAVKELLTYYTAAYSVGVAMCLVGVIASILWTLKCAKNEKEASEARESTGGWLFTGAVTGAGSLIVSLVWAVILALDLLKITLAPRIWLLEYASQLVK